VLVFLAVKKAVFSPFLAKKLKDPMKKMGFLPPKYPLYAHFFNPI